MFCGQFHACVNPTLQIGRNNTLHVISICSVSTVPTPAVGSTNALIQVPINVGRIDSQQKDLKICRHPACRYLKTIEIADTHHSKLTKNSLDIGTSMRPAHSVFADRRFHNSDRVVYLSYRTFIFVFC